MAERRMFAKTIIDSDAFLDMPLSAQALYFHLSMRADDDGFVSNPKKIQRMLGASDDDCKLLIIKQFVLTFESGVIVIKHWRMHNYIQKDRYRGTIYTEEKSQLSLDENNAYTDCIHDVSSLDTDCIHDVSSLDTQVSIGKSKDSIELIESTGVKPQKRFTPPTLEQVQGYCRERNNGVDAERFIDYYTANGWKIGKNQMRDWKAAIRTWERGETKKQTPQQANKQPASFDVSDFMEAALKRTGYQ